MKITQNSGYRELVLDSGDLKEYFFDEVFLNALGKSQEPVVVNLRRQPVMHSLNILRLFRYLRELDSVTDASIVLFATYFISQVLRTVLGDSVPVFTDRRELEVSVRQEVASSEKELLWG